MRFEHYLTEKFNLNYPVKTKSNNYGYYGSFDVGDEGEHNFDFEASKVSTSMDQQLQGEKYLFVHEHDNYWNIDFTEFTNTGFDSPWGISGRLGNKAMKVFSGVATIILKFVKDMKPGVFMFSAKEPSRRKLYNILSKQLSQVIGYKLKKITYGKYLEYWFHK